NYHRASTVYERDPEKVKALLAAAGLKRLEFTLSVNNNWVADLAPSIVDDLKECGITCTIAEHALRWNEFADTGKVLSYDAVLASGDPSRFGNDPDLLLSWWYGDNVWTRGRSCWARDESGSFNTMQTLLQQARAASGDERQELWNQCFDIVADEVPLYGLFHRKLATGWQPDDIAGFRPISVSGLDFLGCTVA
ncbi:MAG: ABC transporter substrate-binding protein, partial [Eggerthellaceae bacterium]|nr:ABC transporter substrate-binding protein [Eggerthellaceae bacterium]